METLIENQITYYDFDEIERQFENLFPTCQIDVEQMFTLILKGNIRQVMAAVNQLITSYLKGEMDSLRMLFVSILIIGILSGIFCSFSDLFMEKGISEIGVYILYLAQMIFVLKAFLAVYDIAREAIQNLILFVQFFVPVFTISVGASLGIQTAGIYNELFLFALWLVEKLILHILLPAGKSYMILAFLNGIMEEERLTLLLELLKKGMEGCLKLILGGIACTSFVQAAIIPVAARVESAAAKKLLSSLPGIGGTVSGMTELLVGSAILIKNAVGILFLVLLFFAILFPLLKILLITLAMKIAGALSNIVSDKRVSLCVDHIGNGCFLLFRCVLMSAVVFVVLLGMITGVAGR